MSKPKRKCGVILVTVDERFNPRRPWDLPDDFESGELFVKNVPLVSALGFVAVFNKHQLQGALADRRWAICLRRGHMLWDPNELDAAGNGHGEVLSPIISRK